MIKTFDLRAREKPLTLYGPRGLEALIGGLRPLLGRTGYPLRIAELDPHEEVGFGGYHVVAFPVEHRANAFGYAFAEDERPGRFDAAAARALGVAEGPDFGRLQRGESVGGVRPEQVVGPTRPGRRIVISGDTRPCQTTEVYAHEAELLVHEATFLADERARARETGHSTAAEAAELARDAGVSLLALTHLSTRYFPRDVRDEARATFPATVVPRDFDAIDVPFPERGAPALVKAEREESSAGGVECRELRATSALTGVGMPWRAPSRATTPLRASHSSRRPASRSNSIDVPRSGGIAATWAMISSAVPGRDRRPRHGRRRRTRRRARGRARAAPGRRRPRRAGR